MGKRIINYWFSHMTVDEIRDDSNLRLKRLNMKSNDENENEEPQGVAYFGG
jgi:hypothetical protein